MQTISILRGVKCFGNQCRMEKKMNQTGFIVASVNKKAIKQSVDLEAQSVRYTPVLAESQEVVIDQFQQAFPDHLIVMTMPVDVLKKNIEIIEKLASVNLAVA